MKKLILSTLLAMMVIAGKAQMYHCEIRNITQPNNTTIDFDVYLYATGTNVLKLGGFQGGINFNYTALANGGTITGGFLAGSSWNPATNAQLPSPQNAPNWNINTTSHQIRLLSAIQTQVANAAQLPFTGPGLKLGTFRMTNTVPFSTCVKPNFIWSFTIGSGVTKTAIIGWVDAAATQSTFTTQTSFSYASQGPEHFVQSNPSINNPVAITNLTANVCDSYSFSGNTYTTSGTYYDTLTAVNGCDSIIALALTVHQTPNIIPEPLTSLTCGNCVDVANLISPLSTMPIGSDTTYYLNNSYTTLFPNPHSICSASSLYMIVKNVNPSCADTAQATITVGAASNLIANQTNTNTTSCATIPIVNQYLNNGSTQLFYNPLDCKKVATITDGNNSLSMGLTAVEESISCSVPTYNAQPYLKRSYHITPSVQDSATVCLYYLQDDITTYNQTALASSWPLIDPATLNGLTISQTHHGDFNTAGHTVTVIPSANITKTFDAVNSIWTVCFHVDSFSYFYAHAANPLNSALSVNLSSFNAVKKDQQSLVSWATASEKNNDFFLIERSRNGVDFFPISSSIPSQGENGNSDIRLDYTWTDEHPQSGHNYYRLKQQDRDGQVTYSNSMDVYFGDNASVRIYPNPAKEFFNIEIKSNREMPIEVYITDATGRKVQSNTEVITNGLNTLPIFVNRLQQGVYFIHVVNESGLHIVEELVKE